MIGSSLDADVTGAAILHGVIDRIRRGVIPGALPYQSSWPSTARRASGTLRPYRAGCSCGATGTSRTCGPSWANGAFISEQRPERGTGIGLMIGSGLDTDV